MSYIDVIKVNLNNIVTNFGATGSVSKDFRTVDLHYRSTLSNVKSIGLILFDFPKFLSNIGTVGHYTIS